MIGSTASVAVSCADLSLAAATALRENSSLIYMCFECRKKQTTLNEIQKQCAQLVSKLDSLHEIVKKHESMLTGLTSADMEKIESTLLPRIISAIENAPRNNDQQFVTDNATQRSSSRTTSANNVSFADVTRNSANQSIMKEKVAVSEGTPSISVPMAPAHELGGLLRSGRRRNNPVNSNTAIPSTPVMSPIPPDPATPRTQQAKSNAVAKLEQTVLFKPKKNQSADKTKDDISAKFDPVAFAVKDVWLRDFGEVAVRCGSKDLALKMVSSASTVCAEKYIIEMQKPLKPRIKIIGFSKDLNHEVLVDKLKQQNNLTTSFDLKVVRVTRNEKRKSNQMSAVIETDATGFITLMKLRRVYLGWERCRLVDATDALRCYNCSEFQHKASACTKAACCPKCAGGHKAEECDSDYEKCINCHMENAKRTSKHDLLDVSHAAWSLDCPINQKHLARARRRIDFSS